MEFRVCFAMAMYVNDMFLLCETSNVFIGAFCFSKIYFHPLGSFKSIKTMLKSLYVFLRMMILKIEFAKNRCLSTIWSTEKIPVAWTYPAREHYKSANFL